MGSCLSADGGGEGGGGGGPGLSPGPSSPSAVAKRLRRSRRSIARADSKREAELHSVPGRMFLNGASSVASLFTQQGRKGTNQDAMIVWENFSSRTDTVFCGVFDGHGPYGHLVARRVRDLLPLKLRAQWEVIIGSEDNNRENGSLAGSMNSSETASICLEEERPRATVDSDEKEKHPDVFTTLKESFLKAFRVMDKELKLHPNVDCFCSGTTAVTLIKQGQDLVIGNVGDSRAVLGTRDVDDSLIAVQLTVDLKPNLPREAERIRKCRGRVFALRDEPEVPRVWLPNNDSPGLAMARAFGDFCLKDYGLISVPEITYRQLTDRDEFVVLATDGIWDVLSNKEVVDIVSKAPKRSYAAHALVEAAVKAWRLKYPTSKIDDCAVVCLFFNIEESSEASLKQLCDSSDTSDENKGLTGPSSLDRSGTVNSSSADLKDGDNNASPKPTPESVSYEQATAEDSNVPHDDDSWSALEGVTRVNTLLTLPRYVAGNTRSAVSKSQKRA